MYWFLEVVEKREREESSELEELERSERRPWRITGNYNVFLVREILDQEGRYRYVIQIAIFHCREDTSGKIKMKVK